MFHHKEQFQRLLQKFIEGDNNHIVWLLDAFRFEYTIPTEICKAGQTYLDAQLPRIEKSQRPLALIAKSLLTQMLSTSLDNDAIYYINLAITEGNIFAKGIKGLLYLRNGKLEQDFITGVKLICDASEQGDNYATYTQARLYLTGIPGVLDKDLAKAITILKNLCAVKNNSAKVELACLYKIGIDNLLAWNWDLHLKLIQEASNDGDINAKFILATLYDKDVAGNPLFQDIAKCLAVTYLQETSECGHRDAEFELALRHRDGDRFLPEDSAKYLELLHRSCELGNNNAITYFAELIYLKTIPITAADVNKAVTYLQSTRHTKHAKAKVRLATLYSEGVEDLLPVDNKLAVKLYCEAIELEGYIVSYTFNRLTDLLRQINYANVDLAQVARVYSRIYKKGVVDHYYFKETTDVLLKLLEISQDVTVIYPITMALSLRFLGAPRIRFFGTLAIPTSLNEKNIDEFTHQLVRDDSQSNQKQLLSEHIRDVHYKNLSAENYFLLLYKLGVFRVWVTDKTLLFSLLPVAIFDHTARLFSTDVVSQPASLTLTKS